MDRTIKTQIENISQLQKLINSKEWANDNQGLLHREAMDIMRDNGIAEEDRLAYLHKED